MKTKKNSKELEFSKNEKEIIRMLLVNGRITDLEISGKLKISSQAVGKIRKKLEDNGIIESYSCNLNYEKMGIGMFCVSLVKLKHKFFEEIPDHKIKDFLKKVPAAIFTCLPTTSEISIISLYAFRNAEEMEKYVQTTKTQLHEYGEVTRMYPFSPYGFVKNNPVRLFNLILDDRPISSNTQSKIKTKNKE